MKEISNIWRSTHTQFIKVVLEREVDLRRSIEERKPYTSKYVSENPKEYIMPSSRDPLYF